jgi:hypothetical protein
VLQKPVVMFQPNSWNAVVGSNVTITCTIMKSTIRPFVVWIHNIKNNSKLCRGKRYHFILLKTEEDQTWLSNLTIFNVTMDDQGPYTCIAKNGAGSGKSAQRKGTLTVLGNSSQKS